MIGSRRKVRLIFDDLAARSVPARARVWAPVGFDIGLQTVPGIAVSIVAEVLARRKPRSRGMIFGIDLNGDEKPDFVAVLSRDHECVVAFLNEGGGKFRTEPIYSAPVVA